MEQIRQRKENNFDFLRFLAATMVVVSHSFWLHGSNHPDSLATGTYGVGPIAVYMFFVISGYLITGSCQNSSSTYNFVLKRLLRVVPALIVATLLVILVVGPLATALPLSEYFSHSETWGYLSNLVFWIQFDLPGVFTENPYPDTVNGSIWTLPFVLLMDMSLVLLALLKMLTRPMVLTGLALLMLAKVSLLTFLDLQSQSILNLVTLGTYFYAGAALYLFSERVRWSGKIAAGLALVLVAGVALRLQPFAFAIALPYLTLYLAFARIPRLSRFGRYGDFSYGIYIFSFPLQQLLILWMGAHELSLLGYLALSVILSTAVGALSWHFVEKPCLGLKRYLPRPKLGTAPVSVTAKN